MKAALQQTIDFIMARAEQHYLGGASMSPEEFMAMERSHIEFRCMDRCIFCKIDADASNYLMTRLITERSK
jgi:hypothetical protein